MLAGLRWPRVWLFWSLASLGVLWERACCCDLRNLSKDNFDLRFASTHLIFLPLALWRLRGSR